MSKYTLPANAYIVRRDPDIEPEDTGKISLILSTEDLNPAKKKADTGEVIYTSEDKKEYLGKRVRFREMFSEELVVEGEKLLYFRDFYSSIWYIID